MYLRLRALVLRLFLAPLFSAVIVMTANAQTTPPTPTPTPSTPEDAIAATIDSFIESRATHILSSSLNLSSRLSENSDINNFWFQSNYSETSYENDSTYTSSSVFLHGGIDYLVLDNLLLGVLYQYNSSDQTSTDSSSTSGDLFELSGTGWMAGPYLVAELNEHISLDARITLGESSNNIEQGTTPIRSEYDTDHLLGSVKFTGNRYLGIGWTILPEVTFAHYEEEHSSFTHGTATPPLAIESQSTTRNRISFGPTFIKEYVLSESSFATTFGFAGVYDKYETTTSNIDNDNDLTMRIDGGVTFTGNAGMDVSINGYYDGVGSNIRTTGINLGFSINY